MRPKIIKINNHTYICIYIGLVNCIFHYMYIKASWKCCLKIIMEPFRNKKQSFVKFSMMTYAVVMVVFNW